MSRVRNSLVMTIITMIIVALMAPAIAMAGKAQITVYPLQDVFVNPSCANGGNGELVYVTGDVHYVAISSSNKTRDILTTMGATGIGQTSGTIYKGTIVFTLSDRSLDNGLNSYTVNETITLASPDATFVSSIVYRFLQKDGVTLVEIARFEVRCN